MNRSCQEDLRDELRCILGGVGVWGMGVWGMGRWEETKAQSLKPTLYPKATIDTLPAIDLAILTRA
jgi:hypothetical protein